MMRSTIKNLLKGFFLFAILFCLQAQAFSQEYRKGELIVELKQGVSFENFNLRWGTTLIKQIYGTNLYNLRTPNGKKEAKWRKKIAKDPNVLSAALNPLVLNPITPFARSHLNFPNGHATLPVNPSEYLSQQLVTKLQLEQLRVRSTGEGITVAVIDTGIDKTHPSFSQRMWTDTRTATVDIPANGLDDDSDGLVDDVNGWDFVGRDGDVSEIAPADTQTSLAGHGTFIAGLISLIAPDAKIMAIRAFDADGLGDAFTVAEAIKYAADHGANIINLSFGSVDNSDILHSAIIYAKEHGAMMIAAAGNENDDTDARPRFPAAWIDETMSVAAVDMDDRKASFSNFGNTVSVAAPGVGLISTFPNSASGDFAKWSGTSFAAPIISAGAALILARNPSIDARSVIETSADNINALNQSVSGKLGKGRVNALEALKRLDTPATANKEIRLQPTGVEPGVRGEAEVETVASEQKFEIKVSGALPRSAYKIFVNGAVILDGTQSSGANPRAMTNAFGGLRLEFSTRTSSNDLPLPAALNPVSVIRQVEVRDGQDRIILQGDFQSVTGGGGTVGQNYHKEMPLASTGVLPQAEGKAEVEIESERQKLKVEGEDLQSGASYQIVVDNVSLGAFVAQYGYIKVELTSDGSKDGPLPAALLPVTNIKQVTILNQANQVVLQGIFQAGDVGGGGGDGDTGGGGGDGCIDRDIRGFIESLPASGLIGDWLVDGIIVHVTASTAIEQKDIDAAIGVEVDVKGCREPDGSITAKEIKTRKP